MTLYLQVLSPRSDIGQYLAGKGRRRKIRDNVDRDKDKENNLNFDIKPEEATDPATMVTCLTLLFPTSKTPLLSNWLFPIHYL